MTEARLRACLELVTVDRCFLTTRFLGGSERISQDALDHLMGAIEGV
jgi:hypothetical protein